MSELLQIVVAGRCLGCDEAQLLYDKVRDAFPHLAVQLLNLDETGVALPDGVFAVPAYLLDGRVIFSGNPRAEELFKRLTDHELLEGRRNDR